MKKLSLYLAKDLAVLIVVSYVSLALFFSIFELAEFTRVVTQAQKPTSMAWELTGWNVFIVGNEIGPLALLVALVIQGASLGRKGEIVAVAAAGISPAKLLVPVATVAGLFALLFFIMADRVTPLAATRVESIMAGELGRGSSSQYFARHRQWFHVGDKFVRVGSIDPRAQSYFDVSIVELDGGHVRSRTTAAEVQAIGADLVGSHVTTERYPQKDEGDLEMREIATTILPLERNFNLFLDLFSRPQNMHLSELSQVWRSRAAHGYDPKIYENEYWGRIAAPFSAFALALLGATYAYAARVRRTFLFALVELLGLVLFAFALRGSFRSAPIVPVVIFFSFAIYRLRRRV